MTSNRFMGWDEPVANYSKLPHQFIDEVLPVVSSMAELKVLLYIIRHTWGYQDTSKRISQDEFQNGRKKSNGERIDRGVQMSINAIKDGIRRAVEHGFITVQIDDSDKARVAHYYSLAVSTPSDVDSSGCQELIVGVSEVDSRGVKSCQSIIERNKRKKQKKKDISDTPSDDTQPDNQQQVGGDAPTGGDDEPEVKDEPKPRPRDVMFDAVAGHIFGITSDDQLKQMQGDDKYTTTAIGQFSNWLKQKSDAIGRGKSKQYVGYITAPAEPRHVQAFGGWLQTRLKGANMPRDPEKLIQWWRAFASEAAQRSKKRQAVRVAQDEQPPMTPEQRREATERLKMLKQQRTG